MPHPNAPSPLLWRLLYQSIMQSLGRDKWSGVPVAADAAVEAKLLANGKLMSLSAKVRRACQTVRLASVFEDADPITETSQAEVGRYALGGSGGREAARRLPYGPDGHIYSHAEFDQLRAAERA
jgi:hypothetical protein